MNRIIQFRGKRVDNGEWAYGYVTKTVTGRTLILTGDDEDFIEGIGDMLGKAFATEYFFEVDPATVGQFTGLQGKYGMDIYEGDIVESETGKPMPVKWNQRFASFCLYREDWAFAHWFGEGCDPERCEVLGNIHDNPELINAPL